VQQFQSGPNCRQRQGEIQEHSQVAGLPVTINNTSLEKLEKHPKIIDKVG
jgi:hypothetical protein